VFVKAAEGKDPRVVGTNALTAAEYWIAFVSEGVAFR
jgi:hypothetical protein